MAEEVSVKKRHPSAQKKQRSIKMDEAEIISGNSPAQPENQLSVKRSRKKKVSFQFCYNERSNETSQRLSTMYDLEVNLFCFVIYLRFIKQCCTLFYISTIPQT